MDEIKIDSFDVARNIFIEVMRGGGYVIRIQCNWCPKNDAVFYHGRDTQACDEDWIALAVAHLQATHPERI